MSEPEVITATLQDQALYHRYERLTTFYLRYITKYLRFTTNMTVFALPRTGHPCGRSDIMHGVCNTRQFSKDITK